MHPCESTTSSKSADLEVVTDLQLHYIASRSVTEIPPHTRQNTPVFDRFESVCESVLRSSDTSCETSIRTFWKFISAFQSRACAPGVDTRKTQQISQENIHIEYCPSKFFTISSQIQVCCSLIHSKESSIASGSRAITCLLYTSDAADE